MFEINNFDIFDHLPTGICIINKDYNVVGWNYTIESWTKIPKANILNQNIREFFAIFKDRKYSSRIDELFAGGPPIVFSSQLHKYIFPSYSSNGEVRIHHTVVSPIPSNVDKEFYAMFSVEDVTDMTKRTIEYRKLKIEAENRAQEISILNEHLTEVNMQKDKFFSIISHDLKSPFNGFLGLTQMLKDSFDSFTKEDVHEMITLMNASANQVWELLNTLLDWARSQTGKIPFNPEINNFEYLINNIVSLLRQTAKNKNIELVSQYPDEAIFSNYDTKMIDTVIRNFVSNSIKFTKENGKIIVSVSTIDDDVIIAVEDNGVGISQENMDKLFKINTQVTTLGTAEEKGTGLGLILCKEFIEKHGGKIKVESTLGVGTKISFNLKRAYFEDDD